MTIRLFLFMVTGLAISGYLIFRAVVAFHLYYNNPEPTAKVDTNKGYYMAKEQK